MFKKVVFSIVIFIITTFLVMRQSIYFSYLIGDSPNDSYISTLIMSIAFLSGIITTCTFLIISKLNKLIKE